MSKGIACIEVAATLANAALSLSVAAESHESGSPAWEMITDAQATVEDLLKHEVNNTWPVEPPAV